jgi:hypothetical protein
MENYYVGSFFEGYSDINVVKSNDKIEYTYYNNFSSKNLNLRHWEIHK